MMRKNDQSNNIIKWIVTIGDFMVLHRTDAEYGAVLHDHPSACDWRRGDP